jgi:outer membrane lipoprotein-sorting protein
MRGWTAALLAAMVGITAVPSLAEDLRAIIERSERQYWGKSSSSRFTMQVVTKNWTRSVEMEARTEGKEKFLAKVLSPAKDRGVATLKVGNEVWNYLPKVDRVIKVPSSMMGEAWMGSHFTNDDLVKESEIEDSYDFTLVEEKPSPDGPLLVISALPKPTAAVVWGKIVYTIRKKDDLPILVVYHEEGGAAVREMRFTGFKPLGGRLLPARMVVVPYDKPGETTTIEYLEIVFDPPQPPGLFSLQSLKQK